MPTVLDGVLARWGADLRAGSRILTRSPGLAAAVVMLIALVIGGNTTVYTVVRGLTTNPAPGVTGSRLISIGHIAPDRPEVDPFTSYPVFMDLSAQASFSSFVAFSGERFALGVDAGTYAVFGGLITPGYFELLGVAMARGRTISASDDEGDHLVAVISHRLWQERFAASEAVVGRPVTMNGIAATIVGVAAPRFSGPSITPREDVWIPLATFWRRAGRGEHLVDRSQATVSMLGQLNPGASIAEAQAELDAISARLTVAHPEAPVARAVALDYRGSALLPVARFAPAFTTAFGAVTALTILIVCANVANLMLGRAAGRQREMALRRLIGASRWRIFRLLFAEVLVLSLIAAAGAIVCAWWIGRWLVTVALPATEAGLALNADLSPDWATVGYAILLAAVATVAITVAPVASAWRSSLLSALKSGESTIAPGRSRLASALVVTQLTFSVVLLVVAGLAYRSHALLGSRTVGFVPDNVTLATVLADGQGNDRDVQIARLEQARERLAALAGAEAATYVRHVPGVGGSALNVRSDNRSEPVRTAVQHVGPAYLAALGLRPLEGRDLAAGDGGDSVVVTRSLAAVLWPGQTAIGQRLLSEGDRRAARRPSPHVATVIGVAPDALFNGATRIAQAHFAFFTEHQDDHVVDSRTFYVRFREGAAASAAVMSAALKDADPALPIVSITTLSAQLARVTQNSRILAVLLGVFAALCIAIATLGQYAVAAVAVRRRTRDYGLRMAFGASAMQIRAGVLREGSTLTVTGLGIGLVLSGAVTTVLANALFGVRALDPVTYGGVLLLIGATTLAAYVVPAIRATRVQPANALRHE